MTVSSTPKNLLWYHWFLMVFGTIALIGLAIGAYFALQVREYRTVIALPFFSALWFFYIFPYFSRQIVVEYTETSILSLTSYGAILAEAFPYSYIARATRRSPTILNLQFTDACPLQVRTRAGHVKLQETNLQGNEDDLNAFSAMLTQNKVSVEIDPIPDNDPVKQVAIALLAIILLAASMAGVFLLLSYIK